MKRIEPRTRVLAILVLALVLVGVVAAGCSSQASTPSTTEQPGATQGAPTSGSTEASPSGGALDGAALVQERCGTCHPVSEATKEDRDAAGWTAIVDDMISKGAQLTPEEKTAVIQYLSENYGAK